MDEDGYMMMKVLEGDQVFLNIFGALTLGIFGLCAIVLLINLLISLLPEDKP